MKRLTMENIHFMYAHKNHWKKMIMSLTKQQLLQQAMALGLVKFFIIPKGSMHCIKEHIEFT